MKNPLLINPLLWNPLVGWTLEEEYGEEVRPLCDEGEEAAEEQAKATES